MSAKVTITILAFWTAVVFAAGYYTGHRNEKVVKVPLFRGLLPIQIKDANSDPAIPDEVGQLAQTPKVETLPDCPVASDWIENYITAPRYPLHLDRSQARLTYMDPVTKTVRIDYYTVPQQQFRWGAYAGIGASYVDLRQWPTMPTLDIRAEIEYRRLSAFAEAAVPIARPDPVQTRVGIRYRFAGN